MKTSEYYLDEVAKENGYKRWLELTFAFKDRKPNLTTGRYLDLQTEAMLRHSKEACKERDDLLDKISSLNGYLKLAIEGKLPRELPAVIAECDEYLLKHQYK